MGSRQRPDNAIKAGVHRTPLRRGGVSENHSTEFGMTQAACPDGWLRWGRPRVYA